MRGKGNVPGDKLGATRITPAYAGKSSTAPMIPTGGWDHPRVCGEKQILTYARMGNAGITPAYAGKSRYRSLCAAACRDHPRVCGEKKKMNARKDKRMGSPPRMRGKAGKPAGRAVRVRITPAYAGKSSILYTASKINQDHPRVCGEKLASQRDAPRGSGSPPRMRGKDLSCKEIAPL